MHDATLILPAPAKLNLFLHILGRRADGYHELQTVFQFLDHGDELGFRRRDDGEIRLHSEIAGVPHDANLIVRAARRLQQASGTPLGADLWLDKRLPMGGGIGGGSSDAATTLLGLNHLWRLGFDLERLAALEEIAGLGLTGLLVQAEKATNDASDLTRSHPDFEDLTANVKAARAKLAPSNAGTSGRSAASL